MTSEGNIDFVDFFYGKENKYLKKKRKNERLLILCIL